MRWWTGQDTERPAGQILGWLLLIPFVLLVITASGADARDGGFISLSGSLVFESPLEVDNCAADTALRGTVELDQESISAWEQAWHSPSGQVVSALNRNPEAGATYQEEFTLTFPTHAEAGIWVPLRAFVSLPGSFRPLILGTGPLGPSIEVTGSCGDVEAPVLVSAENVSGVIDNCASGAPSAEIAFKATDNLAGIESISISYWSPLGFHSASGTFDFNSLLSVDETLAVELPPMPEAGIWTGRLYVNDGLNFVNYALPDIPVEGDCGPTACSAATSAIAMTAAECEALVVFFESTGGESWHANSGWATTLQPCAWFGVFCDAGGGLVSLELPYNGLSGSLPPELGELQSLKVLSLPGNNLSGPIPPELGALRNLGILSLAANRLSGPIPPELGALRNLKALHLEMNRLSGPIPPELGQLPVDQLFLNDNLLSGEVPPELAALIPFGMSLSGNSCLTADAATAAWVEIHQDQTLSDTCEPIGSVFTGVVPVRLFDTRTNAAPSGKVAGGQTLSVQVAGVAGVPANASAVVLNVTGTQASTSGFVTVWPSGEGRPLASSLNLSAGQTAPNLVIVPVGVNGEVSFFSSGGTHLLADVAGFFTPVAVAVSEGRLVSLSPTRLFDTRTNVAPTGKVGGGSTLDVDVAGEAGVPAFGASAVVMNLTGTQAQGAGFVTAFPTGTSRPLASVLNMERTGYTAANLVIVPIGANGQVSLYSSTGVHLLADVVGYITDATATSSTQGLFVPVTPARVYDTRSAPAPNGLVGGGQSVSVSHTNTAGIPATGVAAVSINVTATQARSQGFITAFPTGEQRPLSSVLNLTAAGETRPNAAILPVGTGGEISFFSSGGAHLLADANGYFTN